MNSKNFTNQEILLIGGPTASGKSDLALDLASHLNGEIINCDSMQVYKYFKILTSQPNNISLNSINHHLYGFLDTNKNYSAAIWLKDVKLIIKNILRKKKLPILVGGTGLYFEFLSKGVHLIPKISKKIKEKVKKDIVKKGVNKLHEDLKSIDPNFANKISPNDKQRVMRGVEVFHETGRTITYYQKKEKIKPTFIEKRVLVLPETNTIKFNCERRFLNMIEKGLVEEVKKYRHKVNNCNIIKAIGYKEIIDLLEKKITLNVAIESAVKKTKRYAKRQRTWFSKRFDPHFIINSNSQKSLLLESLRKIN